MRIAPCRPYHSRTVARQLIRMPDGVSAFKVYYVSIVGRDAPTRYEWDRCRISRADFEARFVASSFEGVGFVTAFPHITKVFRFAPAMETVLHVRAFSTADFAPMGLERDGGYVEFACYAEAALAADEYHAWARTRSVAEYLESWSAFEDGPIADPAKLAAHVAAAGRP